MIIKNEASGSKQGGVPGKEKKENQNFSFNVRLLYSSLVLSDG